MPCCFTTGEGDFFVYMFAQLPLVGAMAGCVYTNKFLLLPLLSGTHTMNSNLQGIAINVDCCLLMLCAKRWPIYLSSCPSCSSDSFLQPQHSAFAEDQLQHSQVASLSHSFTITKFLHFCSSECQLFFIHLSEDPNFTSIYKNGYSQYIIYLFLKISRPKLV